MQDTSLRVTGVIGTRRLILWLGAGVYVFSFDLSKRSGNVEFCIATWDVNETGTALDGSPRLL